MNGNWANGNRGVLYVDLTENRNSNSKLDLVFVLNLNFVFFLELTSHGRFNVYHSVHKAAGYMVYVE